MNRIFLTVFILCTGFSALAQTEQQALPKLSPLTRMLLKHMDETSTSNVPEGYIYKEHNGQQYLTGLVQVTDVPGVTQQFRDMGVITGTQAGNIWTVQVPYSYVKAFTQTKGISYIQLDEPLRPAMDAARKTTHVDSVHAGYNLPWPMTGKDIVAGVIDFGFDYGHPSFFDKTGSTYRVKQVWEMGTNGTPPASYTYGHELTGATTIQAQGTDNIVQSHGTATAGITAGSGFGTNNNKLKGVAPDADIVLVGVRRDSIGKQWMQSSFSDFLDGVNYIFKYATSVNKPAVTNISWGSQSGPHDGSSLFNQACDNLSGQGKIISMSAGNEGQEKIHLSKTFTSTDTLIQTFVTFSADTPKRTWIDVWGNVGKTFCAKVTLYKGSTVGNTTGFICIDDLLHSTYLVSGNGLDTCFIDFITSSAEFNNKPRMTLNIHNKSKDSILVSIKGNDGSIDMWDEYYYYGYTYGYSSTFESLGMAGVTDGNTVSTVSDMGSANSVLLVGAYASKINWVDLTNAQWTYQSYVNLGDIVPFSSRGPMADGRIKPDITAPGLTLATAISSYDVRYLPTGINARQLVNSTVFNGKTYYYSEFTGTSASAPMASGIVALMLEANPHLTPKQVQDIIAATAIKDNFTGNLPASGTNVWGHGKINAYAAVKAASQANGIYDFKGEKLDCILFPTPNNGSFTLGYTATTNEQLEIKVYDITGRTLLSESWNVKAGDNVHTISLAQAKAGNYIVTLTSAKGSASIKTQVM